MTYLVNEDWFFKIPSSSAKNPDIVDKDQCGSQTDGIYQLYTWYIRPKPTKNDAYHRFQGTNKKIPGIQQTSTVYIYIYK